MNLRFSYLVALLLLLGCSTVGEESSIFSGTSDLEIESLEEISSSEKVFFTNNATIKEYNSKGYIFDEGHFFTLDLNTGVLTNLLSSSPLLKIDDISDFTVVKDNIIFSLPRGAESKLIFYDMSKRNAESLSLPVNIQSVEKVEGGRLILYQGVYGSVYDYLVFGYEINADSLWGLYPARETRDKIPFATRALCYSNSNQVFFWEPFTDEISVIRKGKISEPIPIDLNDYKADQEYWSRSGMNAYEYLQNRGFFAARTFFANENNIFFVGARVKEGEQELFLVVKEINGDRTFSKRINLGTSDEQFLNTFYQDSLGYFYSIVDGYTLTEKQVQLYFPEKTVVQARDSYYLMKYSISGK